MECSTCAWLPCGSSPLARGLPVAGARGHRLAGIIPARAGFTAPWVRTSTLQPDHPRSRGVYRPRARCAPSPPGSSPLARGLPATRRCTPHSARIIPARAGFTCVWRPRSRPLWDHPRSRGVYIEGQGAPVPASGSSPLARGLLARVADELGTPRIIPARAGFTCAPPRPSSCGTDHPRSRGVYRVTRWGTSRSSGSSPLARGLPLQSSSRFVRAGIIPARAGFTKQH